MAVSVTTWTINLCPAFNPDQVHHHEDDVVVICTGVVALAALLAFAAVIRRWTISWQSGHSGTISLNNSHPSRA